MYMYVYVYVYIYMLYIYIHIFFDGSQMIPKHTQTLNTRAKSGYSYADCGSGLLEHGLRPPRSASSRKSSPRALVLRRAK